MPFYQLDRRLVFPRPELAEDDGLLAVGGDLSQERLLLAYSQGIFPWYSDPYPILWWSPDPRLLLFTDELKVSRSLSQTLKKEVFSVTMDRAFEEVIRNCAAAPRKDVEGTWITEEMIEAYCALHRSGYAHSVECRREGRLVGGLYGVSLGAAFFGESMFARESNASKVALVSLALRLKKSGFLFIDCQVTTSHMLSMGAREVPRETFMRLLGEALCRPTLRGDWGIDEP